MKTVWVWISVNSFLFFQPFQHCWGFKSINNIWCITHIRWHCHWTMIIIIISHLTDWWERGEYNTVTVTASWDKTTGSTHFCFPRFKCSLHQNKTQTFLQLHQANMQTEASNRQTEGRRDCVKELLQVSGFSRFLSTFAAPETLKSLHQQNITVKIKNHSINTEISWKLGMSRFSKTIIQFDLIFFFLVRLWHLDL